MHILDHIVYTNSYMDVKTIKEKSSWIWKRSRELYNRKFGGK